MNKVFLKGVVATIPKLHHTSNSGTDYYTSKIIITRKSGTIDELVIVFHHEHLPKIKVGEFIKVEGEFNSYNQDGHLILFVFCKKVDKCEEDMMDQVEIEGTICKKPVFRFTPKGKRIADVIIAANRDNGVADYFPCVFWGSLANMLTSYKVGDKIALTGRLQSREYTKNNKNNIAYEISANSLLF